MKITSLALFCLVASGADAFSAPRNPPSVTRAPVVDEISHAVAPPTGEVFSGTAAPMPENPTVYEIPRSEAPNNGLRQQIYAGDDSAPGSMGGDMNDRRFDRINPNAMYGSATDSLTDSFGYKRVGEGAAPTPSNVAPVPSGQPGPGTMGGDMLDRRFDRINPNAMYGSATASLNGNSGYNRVGEANPLGRPAAANVGPAPRGPAAPGTMGGDMLERRFDRIDPNAMYGSATDSLNGISGYNRVGDAAPSGGPAVMNQDNVGPAPRGPAAPGTMGGDMLERRFDRIDPNAMYGSATDSLNGISGYNRVGDAAPSGGPAVMNQDNVAPAPRGQPAPGTMGGDMLERRFDRIDPNAMYGSVTDSLTSNFGYSRVGDAAPSNPTVMNQQGNVGPAPRGPPSAGGMGGDMLERRFDRINPNAMYGSATDSLNGNSGGYNRVGDSQTIY